jgi:arabinosyltransferase
LGKINRLREATLWYDDLDYHTRGPFITVDLQLSYKVPEGYNELIDQEPMIQFHLKTLQPQLEQVYVGLALAVALNRTFIMPKLTCFCDRNWFKVERCRMLGATKIQFPVPCPADYYFILDKVREEGAALGPPIQIREYSFLENVRTPTSVTVR